MKSFEALIQTFINSALASAEQNTNYSSKLSVEKHNRNIERYRRMASRIDILYPGRLSEFALLLDADNWNIKLPCAHSILELVHYTPEQAELAISVIRQYYKLLPPGPEKMGYERWIDEWEKGMIETAYSKNSLKSK